MDGEVDGKKKLDQQKKKRRAGQTAATVDEFTDMPRNNVEDEQK